MPETTRRLPLSAHAWTILPNLWHRARPKLAPAAEAWSTEVDDPEAGRIQLRGELRREPGSRSCLIVVHGLGGSIDRHYCIDAAITAARAGISCLRIGLRGADRAGDDFYHAGLSADVAAAVRSSALAEFDTLFVLGYSLGGHVTLRYALEADDPRVRAVAAVCAPLDLDLGAQLIDRPQSFVYRSHVISGLNEIYGAVAERRSVPTPMSQVRRARGIRAWDSMTVVPRYGFGTVDNYYASMSVGPRLAALARPALLVQSTLDPMVPPWTYERHLTQPLPRLDVRRIAAGGHVAFPNVALEPGQTPAPLVEQILSWFARQ